MNLLDRYIARVVVLGTGLALLLLLSVEAFFAFVGEIGDIGEGDYTLSDAFYYLVLTLPRRAYNLFPFCGLLGGVFGLGALANTHELVAVRAAGVSIGRILVSVLAVGLLMQLFATAVGEFIAPAGERAAQAHREISKYGRVSFSSPYGMWARDGDYFVNVLGILPGGRLTGIHVYKLDSKLELQTVTSARYAGFSDNQWTLFQVRQSVVHPDGMHTVTYPQLAWDTLLNPDLLRVLAVDPEFLSTRELYRYINYLHSNDLEAGPFLMAYWVNIGAPFAGLVMMFLSVPFVFGPLRSVSAGQRLMLGVLVGLGFYLIKEASSRLGQVYGIDPVLCVFGPLLLFSGLGLLALRRARV